jgi:hypothetical protein
VVQNHLQFLSSLARSSTLLPDAHVQWLQKHLLALIWYEPASPPGPPPPPGGRPSPNSSWISARSNVRDFDRACGILGFLAPGLRPLVSLGPGPLGLRERSHKALSKANDAALRILSLDLLRGGLAMFERWWGASVSTYRPPPSTPSPRWDTTSKLWKQFNLGARRRPRLDGRKPVIMRMWRKRSVGTARLSSDSATSSNPSLSEDMVAVKPASARGGVRFDLHTVTHPCIDNGDRCLSRLPPPATAYFVCGHSNGSWSCKQLDAFHLVQNLPGEYRKLPLGLHRHPRGGGVQGVRNQRDFGGAEKCSLRNQGDFTTDQIKEPGNQVVGTQPGFTAH